MLKHIVLFETKDYEWIAYSNTVDPWRAFGESWYFTTTIQSYNLIISPSF